MRRQLYPENPILLVDDETEFLLSAELILKSSGINNIISTSKGGDALEIITKTPIELIALDINMPDKSGLDVLEIIKKDYPHIPVIMITAENDIETAVKAIKLGAYNYLSKPLEDVQFYNEIRRTLEWSQLQAQHAIVSKKLLSGDNVSTSSFEGIVSNNSQMKSIFKYIEAIAPTNQSVLISGETGSGKELIAKAIHKNSGCKGKFIAVNAAGLDDQLFSDSLFGHQSGAFSGASTKRKGFIDEASSGTLFLDEIGDLSETSQIKLLRLLQEKEYYPLGSDKPRKSYCRFIFATHRDLQKMQDLGSFRKDLYFRLKMHHIIILPLRKRKEDIPYLIDYFIVKACRELNKKVPTYPNELVSLLQSYHFPGNIRELEAILYDAIADHDQKIMSMKRIKDAIDYNIDEELLFSESPLTISDSNFPTIKHATKLLIKEAMNRSNGNQSIAARMLGFTRQALSQRLAQYKN